MDVHGSLNRSHGKQLVQFHKPLRQVSAISPPRLLHGSVLGLTRFGSTTSGVTSTPVVRAIQHGAWRIYHELFLQPHPYDQRLPRLFQLLVRHSGEVRCMAFEDSSSVKADISDLVLTLLRHCYKFVASDWQHLPRDSSSDQGFERLYREYCTTNLLGWVISQHREMNFGMGLSTSSGILHELDIVAQSQPVLGVLELKNRATGTPVDKNDVIVFFAKIMDYLSKRPSLLNGHLVPVFLSSVALEQHTLAACLGLGIHPVAPMLRPLPMLLDNARRLAAELKGGLAVTAKEAADAQQLIARASRMARLLSEADMNARFDIIGDGSLVVYGVDDVDVHSLANELRMLNAQCDDLIASFRALKHAGGSPH